MVCAWPIRGIISAVCWGFCAVNNQEVHFERVEAVAQISLRIKCDINEARRRNSLKIKRKVLIFICRCAVEFNPLKKGIHGDVRGVVSEVEFGTRRIEFLRFIGVGSINKYKKKVIIYKPIGVRKDLKCVT